jgi:hypothetical protein
MAHRCPADDRLPTIALLIQWRIRLRWPALAEGDHNEVVGFIIAVAGVIYAVLLGFVVIITWESYREAEAIVGQEASVLRSIYRESVASPPETQGRLHDLVGEYATEVTDQEWPAMAQAEPGHPRVGDVLDEMAITMSSVPVTTPASRNPWVPKPSG